MDEEKPAAAIACGVDWASDHHDVALIGVNGQCMTKARIDDNPAGFTQLLDMLAACGDTVEHPIPVAIETSRGLLVAALRTTRRPVFAINPMAAARYRERHAVTRKKSDHRDALTLANILRTDAAAHRPLPADTELAHAIAVLARAQQDAVWDRTQASNKLRSHLHEYYPAFDAAYAGKEDGLTRPDARAVLAAASTPKAATALSMTDLENVLRVAGGKLRIRAEAERLLAALTTKHLLQPPLVEAAMGQRTRALLRQLDAACQAADDLQTATIQSFRQHPDAEIIASFPGLGMLTGARVLAEIGDDRHRFADARSLKADAGAAPITRASGKTITVKARKVKNNRLAAAGYVWAFCALTASPAARAHYDKRRDTGDKHTAAQRNLFNKMLGSLDHCLRHRLAYNETKAFPTCKNPELQPTA